VQHGVFIRASGDDILKITVGIHGRQRREIGVYPAFFQFLYVFVQKGEKLRRRRVRFVLRVGMFAYFLPVIVAVVAAECDDQNFVGFVRVVFQIRIEKSFLHRLFQRLSEQRKVFDGNPVMFLHQFYGVALDSHDLIIL